MKFSWSLENVRTQRLRTGVCHWFAEKAALGFYVMVLVDQCPCLALLTKEQAVRMRSEPPFNQP